MLSYERQNQILDLLKENQYVTVSYLCKKLYSSSATIRRDLTEMSEKGLLTRVRGGAAVIDGTNHDIPLSVRSNINCDKKKIITELALSYIKDSNTIFMDSSSTVTFLAERLKEFRNLTIITNGIATGNVLNQHTTAKLFLCGGYIISNSSLVGQVAVDMIQNFRGDIFFFSCCGISTEAGLTEAIEDNAVVKKHMLKNTKKHILLVDSTKFSKEFFCKSCNLTDIDVIITDKKPNDTFITTLPCHVHLVYPKQSKI